MEPGADRANAVNGQTGLPVPFYQDSAVTIYHGDCREILPTLDAASLILTDPPYVGLRGGTHVSFGGVGKHYRETPTVVDPWNANLDWLSDAIPRALKGILIFCSHHSVAEIKRACDTIKAIALLTWYKRNTPLAVNNVPRFTSEFIWAFATGGGLNWRAWSTTVFDVPNANAGCVSSGERLTERNGTVTHPAQKPLALLNQLMAVCAVQDDILDPFMGTGTTLRAAKDLGRKAIGIEIEERYCEIAAKRMEQEIMDFGASAIGPPQVEEQTPHLFTEEPAA